MAKNEDKVVGSLFWKFCERVGSQGANFILSIILARILSPSEYGIIALITIFISIATVFVQGGFNTALIQNKHVEDDDYSSVLIFSFIIAAVLYSILFLGAPLIAGFYKNDTLILVVRVLSLILFPGAWNSIQVAYVTKLMRFKKLFYSSLISVVLGGVSGIVMAYLGFGVWAIVAQQLITQIVNCLVLQFIGGWIPSCIFSFSSVKRLIPFGSRVLASNLLVTLFLNIRSLIIGRVYSAEDLAYFNRGKTFVSTIMEAINGTIQSVMLPAYSMLQDSHDELKNMLRSSVSLGCYIIFPCLLGLAGIAKPFIQVILTDKWLQSVIFMQIFAVGYMTQPIQIATAQAMKAIGRSDLTLKIEILRKLAEAICLLLAVFIGVKAIAWSSVVAGIISCLLSSPVNKKYLGYSYREQIMDVLSPTLLSLLMFSIISAFSKFFSINAICDLILGIAVGIIAYVGLSAISRNKNFIVLLSMLKRAKREVRT